MAPGRVVVVMVGAALTVTVSDLVAATPSASASLTVKVCVVAPAPTVPEMTPVEALMVRPLGKEPVEMLHVLGVVPPSQPRSGSSRSARRWPRPAWSC